MCHASSGVLTLCAPPLPATCQFDGVGPPGLCAVDLQNVTRRPAACRQSGAGEKTQRVQKQMMAMFP